MEYKGREGFQAKKVKKRYRGNPPFLSPCRIFFEVVASWHGPIGPECWTQITMTDDNGRSRGWRSRMARQ